MPFAYPRPTPRGPLVRVPRAGTTAILSFGAQPMETRRRSFGKALSWRLCATVITALVALAVTGKPAIALEIGLFDTGIKLFAYYGHERLWLCLPYGRAAPPDYEI